MCDLKFFFLPIALSSVLYEYLGQVDFENTIVNHLSPKEFINTAKNVRVLNLFYFYSENNRTCSIIHRGFVETVTKFKGALNIYAISCDRHPNFCERRAKAVPYLIAYKNGSTEPIVFDKDDYTTKLEIWINKIMPSELLEIIDVKQLQSFIENQTITHVCLTVFILFLGCMYS